MPPRHPLPQSAPQGLQLHIHQDVQHCNDKKEAGWTVSTIGGRAGWRLMNGRAGDGHLAASEASHRLSAAQSISSSAHCAKLCSLVRRGSLPS